MTIPISLFQRRELDDRIVYELAVWSYSQPPPLIPQQSHVLNIIDEFVVQPRLQVDVRAVLAGRTPPLEAPPNLCLLLATSDVPSRDTLIVHTADPTERVGIKRTEQQSRQVKPKLFVVGLCIEEQVIASIVERRPRQFELVDRVTNKQHCRYDHV